MLESFPVAMVVGIGLGFLSGLGVGGGSLLIMWLTLVIRMDHTIARMINLISFLPTAAIASFFRWKQGSLELKKIVPAILLGCLSAAIFSAASSWIDLSLLRKLFGGLLIFTGIRELFYRPRNAR